jgi:hypothetical protein
LEGNPGASLTLWEPFIQYDPPLKLIQLTLNNPVAEPDSLLALQISDERYNPNYAIESRIYLGSKGLPHIS